MTEGSLYVRQANLSHAWAIAFLEALKPGGGEIFPLVVTVNGFSENRPVEDPVIRDALDRTLERQRRFLCTTVSNTIFPASLWNPREVRSSLYTRYQQILPGMKKIEPSNKYGLYFERLISFGSQQVNQLEHIITTYQRGNHRRSALQAAIFDPAIDHTHQRQRGFPCLQQVAFAPQGSTGLAVTGFYAVQHLFERAYGNYLGLCSLGQFVAHELGLQLTQMTCIAGVAKIGAVNKREVRGLQQVLASLPLPADGYQYI